MSLKFWKPGTSLPEPGSSLDRDTQAEGTIPVATPSSLSSLSISAQRENLPIYKHRSKILYTIEKHGVTIVWLGGDGHVIACTQPRRVAATSVANRVATEVGSLLGDEVGYIIRFESVSSPSRTRILYMTDGMLFRETLLDPLLSRYSVIMLDEVHERSVYTDLLMGVLKKIRRKRPSLRLIISSATLDAAALLDYFNSDSLDDPATIISLEGRMFPVEIAYLAEPTPDYVSKAAATAWDINTHHGPGDVLIFLTGREEIDRCLEELSEMLGTNKMKNAPSLLLLPLHAVIVSTNIAEASVTIDGIKFVVDCGFVKIRIFNPNTSLSTLTTLPTSLASATQRAGRAGRTSSGICYRLYPQSASLALQRTSPPLLTHTDLTTPILLLLSLGFHNILKFPWPTPPPAENVLRALEGLNSAGLIGEDGRMTIVGEKVAEMPVEVGIARMVPLRVERAPMRRRNPTIAAMCSVQDVFIIPDGAPGALAELERRKFTAEEGDHLTLLNVYNAFARSHSSKSFCSRHSLSFRSLSRAMSIRGQLKKYMQRFSLPLESCEGDAKRLRRCLVSGLWRNGARWVGDGSFKSVRGDKTLYVHPNSVLFTRKPRSGWVVFHEMEETKKTQIRILTEIEPEWLLDYGNRYEDNKGSSNGVAVG
ncbi:pre-mRNA splicing factor [Rhodocollybia butyracea]|uniref:Pre-mRNA splicing factor n=1 Tax=Rhodocollybia butyracea TaxID=206335 RepID=A0A9P5P937_9AGAR|nr:pre-mRNA splicing factor [Rhodocollybia butyracea]